MKTKIRHHYAAQSPRGFRNEIDVYAFASSAARDAFVSSHENDGDCNSAVVGAYAVSAAEARRICGYTGDASTQSFNSRRPILME